MRRRNMLLPVAALAAMVAASPASAARRQRLVVHQPVRRLHQRRPTPMIRRRRTTSWTRWRSRSPAPSATPLTAVAGQALALRRPAAEPRVQGHARRRADVPAHRRRHRELQRHPVQAGRRHRRAPSASARTRPTAARTGGPTPPAPARRRSSPTSRRSTTPGEPPKVRDVDARREHDLRYATPTPRPRAPLHLAHRQQPVPARRVGDDRRLEHGRGRPDRCRSRATGRSTSRTRRRARRATRPTTPTTPSTATVPAGRRCGLPPTRWTPDRRRPRRVHDRAAGQARHRPDRVQGLRARRLQHAAQHPPVRQRLRARADRGLRREQRLHPGRDLASSTRRSRPSQPTCSSGRRSGQR